jgi:hypothetical protein
MQLLCELPGDFWLPKVVVGWSAVERSAVEWPSVLTLGCDNSLSSWNPSLLSSTETSFQIRLREYVDLFGSFFGHRRAFQGMRTGVV